MKKDSHREKASGAGIAQDMSFVGRGQRQEQFMSARDGRVFYFDDSRAQGFFIAPCRCHQAVFISESLYINREISVVVRKFYISVTVANQIGDAVHADIDFIAIQLVEFAIECGHFGVELFTGNGMESVGVALRQFARQKCKILAPLLFGEDESLNCSGQFFGIADAMQLYWPTIVAAGKLAVQNSGIDRSLNRHAVGTGFQLQMQFAGFDVTILYGVSTGGGGQFASVSSAFATKIEGNLELSRLLAGGVALKITSGIFRPAGTLGLA